MNVLIGLGGGLSVVLMCRSLVGKWSLAKKRASFSTVLIFCVIGLFREALTWATKLPLPALSGIEIVTLIFSLSGCYHFLLVTLIIKEYLSVRRN